MTQSDVVCDGAIDQITAADEGDLGAEALQVPTAQIESVDQDMDCGGDAKAVQQIEHGAAATALRAEQRNSIS